MKKQNNFEEKLREQLDSAEWKPSDSLWSRIEQNMDADSFEPALQKKLENYEVKPGEQVWENVEHQLPESRRRRGLFWLASVSMVLGLAFVAGYLYRDAGLDKTLPDNKQMAQVNEKAAINEPSNTTESSVRTTPSEVQMPAPSSGHVNSVSPEIESTSASHVSRSENRSIDSERNISQSSQQVVLPEPSMSGHSGRAPNTPPVPPTVNHAEADVPAPSRANQPLIGSDSSIHTSGPIAQNNQSAVQPPKPSEQSQVPEPDKNTKVVESINVPSAQKDSFQADQVFRGTSYMAPEEELSRYGIMAMAGVNMGYMMLSKPSQSAYGDLSRSFDLRKKIESPTLDFSGGIMATCQLGKGWFAGAGIGIVSMKQSVDYSVAAAQTSPVHVQPANLYVNASDSIIGGSAHSYENKYSFTEIPLMIGYQFKSESNFHLSIMGSVSYARLNLVSAYMPDPGCIGLLVVNDRESFPKFRDAFFFTLSPAVSYNLSSTLELGLNPNVKVALNNMVSNNDWIQQRPLIGGLGIFLHKRF